MDKIQIFINELDNSEYVIIDRGNGEFTSMTKEAYDAIEAAKEATL